MIFVLTGNGKGKTTGAIGMGVRAVGAGKRVAMIQFLKFGGYCEENPLKTLDNFKIYSFGQQCFVVPEQTLVDNPELTKQGVKPLSEKDTILVKQGWQKVKEILEQNQADFLILDEINLALRYKLLDLAEVLDFSRKYQQNKDIVLTGRDALPEIIELADLVTEMREIKHPFQKAVAQRKGIEF